MISHYFASKTKIGHAIAK